MDDCPKHPSRPLAPQLLRENEQADDMGHLALALTYCRMKRMLYFWRGWPNRDAEFLGPQGQAVLHEFKKDFDLYEKYKESTDPAIQKVVQRSSFTDVAVIQLVRIAQAHQWQLTPELKAWIQKACEKNVTSLINEDGFNRQKNRTTMSKTHKGRPQRAFGTLLDEHVADKVHHYVESSHGPFASAGPPFQVMHLIRQ